MGLYGKTVPKTAENFRYDIIWCAMRDSIS